MVYIIIVIGICVGECIIKNYIEKNKTFGTEENILNDTITIQKYHNKGAALNFMEKRPNMVLGVTAALIGILLIVFGSLLPKKGNVLYKLGFALLLGGALSNFSDRLLKGYVTDYFSFHKLGKLKKVVFNLADMFIFLGGIMMAIAKSHK